MSSFLLILKTIEVEVDASSFHSDSVDFTKDDIQDAESIFHNENNYLKD